MKELFLENKLAFIVVVAVLIAAFAVKKAVEYITKKGLEGIRLDVYKLFAQAEEAYKESGQGQKKFKYVVSLARSMLPKAVQVFVTQEMLETAVQLWFDGVKDLLDDGKLNNSTEEVKELNIEDKIMHKTELDDGTYKNYAKNPLPETDREDAADQE